MSLRFDDIAHLFSEKFESDCVLITRLKNQLQTQLKFENASSHLADKMECLISLIKFLEMNLKNANCKIYGSFVRQMFEKMFLSTYDESGYGDSQNHDVDCTVFDSEEDYTDLKDEFWNIVDTFEVLEKLDYSADIKFGKYFVVKVNDITMNCDSEKRRKQYIEQRKEEARNRLENEYETNSNDTTPYVGRSRRGRGRGYSRYYSTEGRSFREQYPTVDSYINYYMSNVDARYSYELEKLDKEILKKFNGVPHAHIILKNPQNNTYVIVDLLGFPIASNAYNIDEDIDVNTLSLTRDGIKSKADFFTTLQSIQQRRGIMKTDIQKMKDDLENRTMSFSEKSNIYNNIIHFTGFRTKILAVGYDSIESESHMCDIQIEMTEDCPISSAKAPYPVINLDCGHSISVIALSGLVNIQASDYTESVRCPHCRASILPKMIEKKPTFATVPDPSIVSKIYKSGMSRRNSFSDVTVPEYTQKKIISSENVNTMLENMGLREKRLYDDVINIGGYEHNENIYQNEMIEEQNEIEDNTSNTSNSSMPTLEPFGSTESAVVQDWGSPNRAWDEIEGWSRTVTETEVVTQNMTENVTEIEPAPELVEDSDPDEIEDRISFSGNLASQCP